MRGDLKKGSLDLIIKVSEKYNKELSAVLNEVMHAERCKFYEHYQKLGARTYYYSAIANIIKKYEDNK